MPGKLRNSDMRGKRRGHHATIHHACRRRRLHNNAFASPACIARPDRPFDPDNRGHDVERLADVRADAMKFERTAGARLALRLDGQAADIARRCPSRRHWPLSGCNIVIGCNGNITQIAQIERRLHRIEHRHLLRFCTKKLALKEGNTRFEIGILFVKRENDPDQLRSILG